MLKAESPEKSEIHYAWYHNKAEEIQQYTDSHNSKRFYDALKTVWTSDIRLQTPPQCRWDSV